MTLNRGDFAQLHAEYVRAERTHAGIVLSRQAAVGAVVRALAELLASRSAPELANRLHWLGA